LRLKSAHQVPHDESQMAVGIVARPEFATTRRNFQPGCLELSFVPRA